MLKEADKLLDPDISVNVGYFRLVPFVTTLKAMNKVVSCCFTTNTVGPELDKHISELRKALGSLEDVSETLKIHVSLKHIKDCVQFLNNNGLGLWSEQAGESIHRDFLTFWNRYKIKNLEDSSYGLRLKKAVVAFSSFHI